MMDLPKSEKFWLPYDDTDGDRKFKNIYTKTPFDTSLFASGHPWNRKDLSVLAWEMDSGAKDKDSNNVGIHALCQPGVKPNLKRFKIRGLCPSSKIENIFYVSMTTTGKIIWIGAHKKSVIQITESVKKFSSYQIRIYVFHLRSLTGLFSANVPQEYSQGFQPSTNIVGRHKWLISRGNERCSPLNDGYYDISFR